MTDHFWHTGPNGRHKCMTFEVGDSMPNPKRSRYATGLTANCIEPHRTPENHEIYSDIINRYPSDHRSATLKSFEVTVCMCIFFLH